MNIDMRGPAALGSELGTPLGNGIFGVRQNGGVEEDVFQLNHTTLWWGDPRMTADTWCAAPGYGEGNAPEVRRENFKKLVHTLQEAYRQGTAPQERADLLRKIPALTKKVQGVTARELAGYLSMGSMILQFSGLEGWTNYQRTLNLEEAAALVQFQKDGVTYKRESFVSSPDHVLAVRLTNDGGRPMEMKLFMALQTPYRVYDPAWYPGNRCLIDRKTQEAVIVGRAPYHWGNRKELCQWAENRGVSYEGRARVVLPQGGRCSSEENAVSITGAREILIYFTCGTSFKDGLTDPAANDLDYSGVDYKQRICSDLDRAVRKGFDALKKAHLAEYQPLYSSFQLELEGDPILSALTGAEVSPRQYAVNYQFGRYYRIANERADSPLPHALRGMWCYHDHGNQNGYFLNENMEKYNILTGPGHLAGTSRALNRQIRSWNSAETGQQTAVQTYGAEPGSWVVSHSSDPWGSTVMYGEEPEYGSWLAGGMWMMDTLYDRYDFTQDISLLRELWPDLAGAARMALSMLYPVEGVQGELRPYLSIVPSGSPEHWYSVEGQKVSFDVNTACDVEIFGNLFQMVLEGAADLQKAGIPVDTRLVNRVREAKSRLIPLERYMGADGCLKEWYNEYPTGDPCHRHGSHLLHLMLNHLEPAGPEVMKATVKEADRWAHACQWGHPDRAVMLVRAGMPAYGLSLILGVVDSENNHQAAMADAPLTGCVGEALLDSRFHRLNVLAYLPEQWHSGSVKGMCGRGGYVLDFSWKDGELEHCTISSKHGKKPEVLCRGIPVDLEKDSRFTLKTEKME